MSQQQILILGGGHLASRLNRMISAAGYAVHHSDMEAIRRRDPFSSLPENLVAFVNDHQLAAVSMVYLLDERDEVNLQLIIAFRAGFPQLRVTASLFNENLIPHLQQELPGISILNPAKIAAPAFVATLYTPLPEDTAETVPAATYREALSSSGDRLLMKLLVAFVCLFFAAVVYFRFAENLSWIDAFYFVVVTVATVGYGDISLQHSAVLSKIIAIILIFGSTVFIWMIFSLTIDRILKNRIRLALGRKKYNWNNHVVVCGLGRLGYFIVEELLQRKERVIIIEEKEDSRHIEHFRHLGAAVYIGDARLAKTLNDVNIARARALFSVINDDSKNLEIGLGARSYNPTLRLILRVFDDKMAAGIRAFLPIHFTLSTSALADDEFLALLKKAAPEGRLSS